MATHRVTPQELEHAAAQVGHAGDALTSARAALARLRAPDDTRSPTALDEATRAFAASWELALADRDDGNGLGDLRYPVERRGTTRRVTNGDAQ